MESGADGVKGGLVPVNRARLARCLRCLRAARPAEPWIAFVAALNRQLVFNSVVLSHGVPVTSTSMLQVLLSICSLLTDPNPDDPLVPDIAHM